MAAFIKEFGVGQVIGTQRFAIVPDDPVAKLFMQLLIEKYALVSCGDLLVGKPDAQPKARGPAAIAHALSHVNKVRGLNRIVGSQNGFDRAAGAGMLFALHRRDHRDRVIRQRHQLTVEKVRSDGVFE